MPGKLDFHTNRGMEEISSISKPFHVYVPWVSARQLIMAYPNNPSLVDTITTARTPSCCFFLSSVSGTTRRLPNETTNG
ncbi:hypothetical protein AG1IA_08616 [Rhizoctonia solani AG-1 IA]|uniref:Uncharacterized protein n=1 Tax=Thanatephorus cucumeris (strain AG1-IA) TaxID=983506 RepID=L8WKM5_THACA|nr:hypothetical protein AG1IA_08616 [Rhizoctonia solani AG-1 IA]